MQNVLGRDRLWADARVREGDVLRDGGVEVVAHHEHVEVLLGGVAREGQCRIGRGRQDVGVLRQGDDVRCMAAARALGVESVDDTSADGAAGVLHETALVERVGVDGDLHVELVGDLERLVDDRVCGAPILVDLEADRSGAQLLGQRLPGGGVALGQQTDIHREVLDGLEHAGQVPGPGRDRGGVGAIGGARPPSDHGGHA